MTDKPTGKFTGKEILMITLFVVTLPVVLCIILFSEAYAFWREKWLGFRVRNEWLNKGKNTLFVYSNDPSWQNYVESSILPNIEDKAYVLNWSEHNECGWGKEHSLEMKIFRQWTDRSRYTLKHPGPKSGWNGDQFNPIAIVFNPWHKPKVLPFFEPLREKKPVRNKTLKELEEELFKSCRN